MGIYDYWFDAQGVIHKIEEMDTSYIERCITQLEKMNNSWWDIDVSELTKKELKDKDEIGQKAWFVIHGKTYLDVLKNELDYRGIQ